MSNGRIIFVEKFFFFILLGKRKSCWNNKTLELATPGGFSGHQENKSLSAAASAVFF